MEPDVVIPVRIGDYNPELRYALRTIAAYLPHNRVWISGHKPNWVDNVGHIKTSQKNDKHENAIENLLAACNNSEISEEFVLWNDDIFLLGPMPDGVPPMHRGSAKAVLAAYGRTRSAYLRGMENTIRILRVLGYEDPLSYELHVPLPMTKCGVLEAYEVATARGMPRAHALQLRSLYGNMCEIGGVEVEDVKVFALNQGWKPGPIPFVSTMDHIWGKHVVTQIIEETFPIPGPYEVADENPGNRP